MKLFLALVKLPIYARKRGKRQNSIKEGNQLEIIDNNRQQGRAFLTIDQF